MSSPAASLLISSIRTERTPSSWQLRPDRRSLYSAHPATVAGNELGTLLVVHSTIVLTFRDVVCTVGTTAPHGIRARLGGVDDMLPVLRTTTCYVVGDARLYAGKL